MHLYLIRHGQAADPSKDPQKGLSDYGKREIELLALQLKEKNIEVSEIRHSEKLRAKQTAETLAKSVISVGGMNEVAGLNPADPIENMLEELKVTDKDLMLVGHNPYMEELVHALTGEHVAFKTGTMIALSESGGYWHIEFKIQN